ncbi:MAG: biotin synthase BioB [bacterium]|jgi:biotin synthase|nr:biotin synthase BioB [bacterium]MDD3805020.1 biotin synthase BioB [bacterium]MDD4152384.1 biotin synthase BioB [bacterium]MDD4558437.1 biotin synthase BioB [bacterium]
MQFNKILELFELPLSQLALLADTLRNRHDGNLFETCTICNVKCGNCSEDCKFCAQSVRCNTGVETYPLISVDEMVEAADAAAANGADRFGIVTSGRRLNDREVNAVSQAISLIMERGQIEPCASLGILSLDQFKRLKDAGLNRFHHNIETASSYFPQITSTHTFEDRLHTIDLAREAGLSICCGGIIGMGESREDRARMALELAKIAPDSIPVNILMPIPGTPLENYQRISISEALRTIAVFRIANPRATIRLAAGRESFLGDFMGMAFMAGANAMMIGGYLTQRGRAVEDDQGLIREVLEAWNG